MCSSEQRSAAALRTRRAPAAGRRPPHAWTAAQDRRYFKQQEITLWRKQGAGPKDERDAIKHL